MRFIITGLITLALLSGCASGHNMEREQAEADAAERRAKGEQ